MSSLYDLTGRMKNLEDCFCEDNEVNDYVNLALDNLDMEFEEKVENIVKFIKNMESDVKAIKEEKKRLNDKQKVLENRIERMKDYISDNMALLGKKKVKAGLFNVSIRKCPPSVLVEDLESIPELYKVIKYDIDKVSIKEVLKNGGTIEGCKLESKESLSIK